MTAFRFRAQAALDLRARAYDEARRALAVAEARRDAAQRSLDQAADVLADAMAAATVAVGRSDAPSAMPWHRAWLDRLTRARTAAAGAVREGDAEVMKAREACDRARQRVESLERLRERAQASWLREMVGREQREADELATLRFVAARRATEGTADWRPQDAEGAS
jgi:flagellar export protein FliJ